MSMPAAMAAVGVLNTTGRPSSRMVASSGCFMPYSVFIRVDVPAPFSPTTACTSPRPTVRLTSELATTPGNRLVIPRSSITGAPAGASASSGRSVETVLMVSHPHTIGAGPEDGAPDPAPWSLLRSSCRSGGRRDLQGAVLDLLLVLLQLGLDVVHEPTAGGVADTAVLEGVGLLGRLAGVLELLDRAVDGRVDLLDHRGQDVRLEGRVADGVVLVGVDPDGPLLGVHGGGEAAVERAAGRGVDDVRTVLVHRLGGDLGTVDVAEARAAVAGGQALVVDLDAGLDGLGTLLVTGPELGDQRALVAADEADVVGLGLQGRGGTDEEGALVLGEVLDGDVRDRRRVTVDADEVDVGVLLGHRVHRLAVAEADTDDGVVAVVGQLAQQVGAVRAVLLGAELLDVGAHVGLGLLQALDREVVERAVTTATHVEGHADLQRLGGTGRGAARGAAGGRVGRRLLTAAAARGHRERGSRRECHHLHHRTQGVSPSRFRCSGAGPARTDGAGTALEQQSVTRRDRRPTVSRLTCWCLWSVEAVDPTVMCRLFPPARSTRARSQRAARRPR